MLCVNMCSILIPTHHIYIHKYRNYLFVDTPFLNTYILHVLKKFVDCMSYTIMLKYRDFEWYAKKKTLFEHWPISH